MNIKLFPCLIILLFFMSLSFVLRIEGKNAADLIDKADCLVGCYEDFISYAKIDGESIYIKTFHKKKKDFIRLQKGIIEGNNVKITHSFKEIEWIPENKNMPIEYTFKGVMIDGIEFK